MKKINDTIKIFLFAAILTVCCITCIILCGKTHTLEVYFYEQAISIDDFTVCIEDGNNTVEIAEQSFENGTLTVKLKYKNQGITSLQIDSENQFLVRVIPVFAHKLGIITSENYFGSSTGDIAIPISISLFLAYALLILVKRYKNNKEKSLCQYKNIAFLGLIIFLFFVLIYNFTTIFNYKGLYETITAILDLFILFSYVLLPIALVVSVFVIISNIVLVKREGFTLRNLLGLILGGLLCCMTVFPDILSRILYLIPGVDVSNTQAFPMYLHLFVENAIYIFVTYLECVLIATIILAFKAARNVPKTDKDFILILGCQIRKDGNLTKLLQSRVDRAIEFYNIQMKESGKELIFVPSGGKGSDEIISEAEAIGNYLSEQGFPPEKILIENKSTNTYENIKFSYEKIKELKEDAKIAFSTTNYHVFRAGSIAYEQGVQVEGIGAKTKAYFWINAFIREFIATLVSEKKIHILTFGLILLSTIFIMTLFYFANTIY